MKPEYALTLSCRVAAILLLAGVAACTTGARNWARPGVSESQRSADYNECRSQMRAVMKQSYDIDQDISSSLGSDWRRLGQYNTQQSQLSQGDADSGAQVMRNCMTDKGYRPL
ncbi:hypothetical protein GCM10011611_30330 [Aliidongia dinghuensis]|uniref:Lipoprotein n=1 Tax=Aliidongia dinghuensis TaxID=1867774 RepID=A0A8J2YUB4_9PROT|nr:hypothetical protein [Aliidongia dinghuensis]GGF22199.1 hypothetical protein GCM10011611_30330 [Aliidongia dinghuensis]